MTRDIHLVVERIVLSTGGRTDGKAMRARVAERLEHLIAERGLEGRLAQAQGALRLPSLAIELRAGLDAEDTAEAIARAIHEALTGGAP